MGWEGGLISDSGGFQVMSLVKRSGFKGSITDEGMTVWYSKKTKVTLSPEDSIAFQMILRPDMVVVLDDFTTQDATREEAVETVERTIRWAKRCKVEFEQAVRKRLGLEGEARPYLLGVVQGGSFMDLRKDCLERLVEIGFDGLGFGGWPVKEDGAFHYEVADLMAKLCA
jgi:queuine tRNA-ribosyltransferase